MADFVDFLAEKKFYALKNILIILILCVKEFFLLQFIFVFFFYNECFVQS